MKKYWRILPILLIISILSTSLGLVSYARDISYEASAGEFVVYVSPDGDDKGDGTPENMLRTPAGVQTYLRNSNVLRKRPVRVIFKPGNYYIDKGLVFQKPDAGTEECPVVWEAETKGTAHFYGTTVLDNSLFEPVTDESILNRLPASSQGKVVQLDLNKMNIKVDPPKVYTLTIDGSTVPFVNLFSNGKEQMLSRWPNGECQYAIWDKVIYRGSTTSRTYTENDGGIIQFSDPRVARWTTAKHAYIRGHVGVTWACENLGVKTVDPTNSTITFNTTPTYYLLDSSPRELQIFNLLEEIDCATEWYIDFDTNILYYYPPKEITMEDEIELTTLKAKNMITFESGADLHMTLKGLDISRTIGRAMLIQATNVTIDNCIITYSKEVYAVKISSTDFRFINNYMAHNDGSCLYAQTSDSLVNDRTADRVEIKNNYMTQSGGMMGNSGHAMRCKIRHGDVHNNTIHNMYYGAQIANMSDSTMKYNEIYNFGKDVTDVGAYYVGKSDSGLNLGVDLEYNFIYDYGPVNPNLDSAVQGIYFDDGHSFSSGRYNIFVNGARSAYQVGGGDRNVVEGNIMIGMGGNNFSTDNRRETWTQGQDMLNSSITGLSSSLAVSKHFAKIDPYLNSYLSIEHHFQPIDNVIRNNLSDKPFAFNARMNEFGRIYNNKVVDDYSHFVDPDNYDFRLKDDSPYAKMIPELTESNFDLWSVGASMEVTEGVDKSFEILYPTADGEFNSTSDMLTWSKANMVDEYRVYVATDKEMKNIIVDETVYYNSLSVEDKNLEEGKEYWWRVEAVNKSFKRKSSWGTEPQRFVNTNNYISAVDTIKYKIEKNERALSENNLEMFGEKEIKNLQIANEKSMKEYRNALKSGIILKDKYDGVMFTLNNALQKFENSEKLNFVHLTPEEITNKDLWLASAEVEMNVIDNKRMQFKRIKSSNIMFNKDIGQSDIIQFRAKIDYNPKSSAEATFASFDLRRQDYTKVGWSDSRSVMFIIKKHKIELQFYPAEGLILEVPNKWDTDGKWHEYAIGVVNKTEGARIILMIDGEIAIDYYQYNNLVQQPGKFAVYLSAVDVELEESEYGALETNPLAVNYFVGGVDHSEEGLWTKSQAPGFKGSYVKQIASGSGTATWKFEDINGKKKVYFRKIVAADGDKNSKLEVHSNKVLSMEGDEVVLDYPIDMSSGEDEWILIEDGRFQQGAIEIKLTGSGSGTLYANAIRIEDMEE